MNDYHWVGPFRMEQLLGDVVAMELPRPPERESAYVVTQRKWEGKPSKDAIPLYVGGNSGRSNRFRTRLGDLIADTFGFFGGGTGHHSDGQSLNNWCQENHFDPLQLYVGWGASSSCHRCLEVELFERLSPTLNRMRPSRCPEHPHSNHKRK